jgi:hypothetical protein
MITDYFKPKAKPKRIQEGNEENMNVNVEPKKVKGGWAFDLPSSWKRVLAKEIEKEYYRKVAECNADDRED